MDEEAAREHETILRHLFEGHSVISTRRDQRNKRPGTAAFTTLLELVLVTSFLANAAGYHAAVHKELKAVQAKLDKTDPKWRWEDMMAQRNAKFPESKETVALVLKLGKQINASKYRKTDYPRSLDVLPPPNVRLSPQQAKDLRNVLRPVNGLMKQARSLADRPVTRFPPKYDKEHLLHPFSAHEDAFWRLREVLSNAALHQTDEGNLKEAWQSSRAMWWLARSVGTEPVKSSQNRRALFLVKAIEIMERVLAQGEWKADELAKMQEQMEAETNYNLLELGIRGTRGWCDHFLNRAQQDPDSLFGPRKKTKRTFDDDVAVFRPLFEKIPPSRFVVVNLLRLRYASKYIKGYPELLREKAFKVTGLQKVIDDPLPVQPWIELNRTWLLEKSIKAIQIARMPHHQQSQQMRKLDKHTEKELRRAYLLQYANLLLPGWPACQSSCTNSHTLLRCAIVGMACERFRMKHNRWPTDLKELVKKKFLKDVPNDPWSGKQLSYRRGKNGVSIYSVGEKGKYKGDSIDNPKRRELHSGQEFRLWNLDRRRLPPKAKE